MNSVFQPDSAAFQHSQFTNKRRGKLYVGMTEFRYSVLAPNVSLLTLTSSLFPSTAFNLSVLLIYFYRTNHLIIKINTNVIVSS